MNKQDKEDLIERIKYSNEWNNTPCPEWVFKLIKAVPDNTVEFISEYVRSDGDLELNRISRVLIRCKDCIHYEEGKCNRFLCGVYVPKNHFCGWGDRK